MSDSDVEVLDVPKVNAKELPWTKPDFVTDKGSQPIVNPFIKRVLTHNEIKARQLSESNRKKEDALDNNGSEEQSA